MEPTSEDARWMALALEQARWAAAAGEVPVGAVVVRAGQLVAAGRNSPIASHDPTAHAEVNALRAAAAATGNYRLDGCTLYVTLEPCAMCAGAMLHARLARVVYGAPDPRTGAAGSVLDLFGQPLLNHHTQVDGQVSAEACGLLLQDFFRTRRAQAREAAQPLRDDALRTPEARFEAWSEAGPMPLALADLPSLAGWRMRYVDTAPDGGERQAVVCLHGWGQWGHLFRHLLPHLAGHRVLVPDLIGFGRSDKPKREAVHTPGWHLQVLREWLNRLDVEAAWVVHHPDAAALAAALVSGGEGGACIAIDRAAANADVRRAWEAPFPDRGYEAAMRAFGQRGVSPDDLAPEAAAEVARRIMRAKG